MQMENRTERDMHENQLRDLVLFQIRKEILTLLRRRKRKREGKNRRLRERKEKAHSALGVKLTHPALTGTACTISSFPSLLSR